MRTDKSFGEILEMVENACSRTFYYGSKGFQETVLKCATEIYIAQMKEAEAGEQNG